MIIGQANNIRAQIRGLLLLSSNNVEYLNVIDSAMFVLCLDAGSPDTPEQIARQAYIGDGSNRWFDKVLQFYVSANGRAGLITEHGTIDGTTPYRLLEWVANAMDNHSAALTTHGNSQPNGQHHSPDIELEEMVLQTNSEIDDHMVTLKKRYQQATSKSSYVREQLDEFGTDFLLKSRVPLKGVIDLTFQLALRLFFGQNMFSWEPTSAALFHAGRSDAMQRASPAVNAFCDAATTAADQVRVQQGAAEIAGPSLSELRNLLVAATKSLNASMQILFTGRSYMRLLEVLSHLWSTAAEGDGTPMPPFLKDAVWLGRSRPAIWAQSNAIEAQMVVEDFVHIMPDTEGFWSFIVPEKNRYVNSPACFPRDCANVQLQHLSLSDWWLARANGKLRQKSPSRSHYHTRYCSKWGAMKSETHIIFSVVMNGCPAAVECNNI